MSLPPPLITNPHPIKISSHHLFASCPGRIHSHCSSRSMLPHSSPKKPMRQCAIGQASLAPMSSSDVMESSPRHLPHPARYRDLASSFSAHRFQEPAYHVRVHYPLWIRDA
ncbi:hypothetical protein A9K55_002382 [Cordyceps militaris]|uniref:Uncharacterized protein n=1 Tax=Cordyceps militaris TaxID=73501 RepID=A0A2H4S5C4_CORMI|nr:hypothetical protein A9K55_002382 [Cordyceps militaris]